MSKYTANKLIRLGFRVTPVKFMEKRPILNDWPNTILGENDIELYFGNENTHNIGVVLGSASNGLVDVDLDTDVAVRFAKYFLPPTGMVFGRDSRPASHYIYLASGAASRRSYQHPLSNDMIVELRANGQQTVFPGSTHKEGDTIRFEDGKDENPAKCVFDTLNSKVRNIAIATTLFDYWKKGNRHKLALAFSGFCAANSFSQADCADIIEALCNETVDEEKQDRMNCVADSYNKFQLDQRALGVSGVEKIIGDKLMKQIREWMGIPERSVAILPSGNLTQFPSDFTTDHLAAKAFADVVKRVLLYSGKHGRFYRRINDVYEPVDKAQAMQLVIDFVNEQSTDPKTVQEQQALKSLQSLSRMSAILKLSESNLNTDSDKFDSNRTLAGCLNGVLDIQANSLVTPTTVVTKRLGTMFEPTATCPLFEKFVSQIMGHDADLIAYLKRAVGYSLTGLVSQQCMFVGIGSGANGKSTFQNVIQSLLGDYGASTPMHALMASKSGNDKTDDLAALPGKRFVSAQEGESTQSLAAAKMKMMTGEDKISCRHLYGHLFSYYPEFKLWMFTNELPKIPGGDGALWRRVHIVPFNVTIPACDRNLKLGTQLLQELPGILNWALDGFAEYQKLEGLHPPASVVNATTGYRKESDVVQQFVDACCDPSANLTDLTMMSIIYRSYDEWCRNSAIDPVSNVMFGKELERLGFSSKKTSKGTARRGIRLIPVV